MSGAHRGGRGASTLKSAVSLLQLAAAAMLLLLLLALAGLVVYVVVANPGVPTWLLPVVIVLVSALWTWTLAELVRLARRQGLGSPASWARVIQRVLALSVSTIVLLTAAGQPYGLAHGTAKSALTWCGTALAGVYICWLIGEGRLVRHLTARAASRQNHSA